MAETIMENVNNMSRNPNTCPHNLTETEDGEWFCSECGEVLGTVEDAAEEYDD